MNSGATYEALPVARGFGDIFTDLYAMLALVFKPQFPRLSSEIRTLRRQTQRANLWGEGGGGTHFTTGRAKVDDLDLARIEFWRCARFSLAVAADQKDDTHAWLVREVVCLN